MIDLVFSRLLNASSTVQRSLALTFIICVILTAVGIALSIFNHFHNQTVELNLLRETAGNLQSIADRRADLIGNLEFRDTDELIIKQSLVGETPAIARANLQTKLGVLANETGATIVAVGNAQDFEDSNVKFVGLSTNLSGSAEAVHKAIFALENSLPPLFFKNFSVHSNSGSSHSADGKVELTAKFLVYGAYSKASQNPIKGQLEENISVQGTIK